VGVWKSNQNTAETKAKINRGRQAKYCLFCGEGNRRKQIPQCKWGRKNLKNLTGKTPHKKGKTPLLRYMSVIKLE